MKWGVLSHLERSTEFFSKVFGHSIAVRIFFFPSALCFPQLFSFTNIFQEVLSFGRFFQSLSMSGTINVVRKINLKDKKFSRTCLQTYKPKST